MVKLIENKQKKFDWKWAITLFSFIVFYAIFEACLNYARADLVTDTAISPAYSFMPQNIHHNIIYNNSNTYATDVNTCKNVGTVTKILVEKSKKTMTLYDINNCIVKQYNIRVGLNSGPKQCEGDMKTPEGTYKIKNKRASKYVKFLELDYPRSKDTKKAKELGCNPGNAIGIHYYNKEFSNDPSTMKGSQGCITVFDKTEIREIDRLVRVGTEVKIVQ